MVDAAVRMTVLLTKPARPRRRKIIPRNAKVDIDAAEAQMKDEEVADLYGHLRDETAAEGLPGVRGRGRPA
jgi:hypothetical protein